MEPEFVIQKAFDQGVNAAIKLCKEHRDKCQKASESADDSLVHSRTDIELEIAANLDIVASNLEDLKNG